MTHSRLKRFLLIVPLLLLISCQKQQSVFVTQDAVSSSSISSFSASTEAMQSGTQASITIQPTMHSPDISILYPNDEENFSMTSDITIRFTLSETLKKKITKDTLEELYLLKPDGLIEGYITGVTDLSATYFVWHPEKLQHWGGLDTSVQAPPGGHYKVLFLIRDKRPSNGLEGPVDILTDGYDKFDGEKILSPDTSGTQSDYSKPFITQLIASDTGDSFFTLK